MKTALVCGAGGFIGGHLVTRLVSEGYWVRGVDLKFHEYKETDANDFLIGDLRNQTFVDRVFDRKFDEVYQLAADMGGAGYIFTGENDASIMHNSALINLNVLHAAYLRNCKHIYYSSSACMYPEHNQLDPENPNCTEHSAYPANPDSEYGWEKLFSERLYLSYARNYGIKCRIGRYHNIFGPLGTWDGGKEKAPAAMCRKAASTENGGSFDVWGDGFQTRSFLYIDDCIEATLRIMHSEAEEPLNIGSEEMVRINDLAKMAIDISGKNISINNIPGPEGVRGRNSENTLVRKYLKWEPELKLREGMERTFDWINKQVNK